jgi:hypothetical protein
MNEEAACIYMWFSEAHLFHKNAAQETEKKFGCVKNNRVIMIKYDGKFNILYKFLASVYCFLFRGKLLLVSCLRVCGTLLKTSTVSMSRESISKV